MRPCALAVAFLLLFGACSSGGATVEETAREGRATVAGLDGGRISVPADAVPSGSTVTVRKPAGDDPARPPDVDTDRYPGSTVGEVVVFDTEAPPTEPVEIELPYDPSDYPDTDPVLYVWEPAFERWMPQESALDSRRHVVTAETEHLSGWTLGHPLYWWGRVTGDRSTRPECGPWPDWLKDASDVEDPNTSVYACAEDAGDDTVRVKLRSNRGVPLVLWFDLRLAVTGGDWMSREMTRAVFGQRAAGVFLAPLETVELAMPRPEVFTVLGVHRGGNAGQRMAMYFLSFLVEHVGEGTLILDLARCAKAGWDLISDEDEALARAADMVDTCVSPRLRNMRETGVVTVKEFDRLDAAFAYWKLADELTKMLDATVVDTGDDLVFSLHAKGRKPVPRDGPGASTEDESDADGSDDVSSESAALLLVDTSGSKSEDDGTGTVKLDGARSAILDFVRGLPEETLVGVRTYPSAGQTDAQGCAMGRLVIPTGPVDATAASALVRSLTANGDTPTSAALRAAGEDLRALGVSSATIVLISDGLSNCGDDACATANQIASSGIDVSVSTLGFRISPEGAQELRCIADTAKGVYEDIQDSGELVAKTAELSQPKFRLDLDYEESLPAASALVEIQVDVHSIGATPIRDAQVAITFDAKSSAGVLAPRRRLGNLEPGRTASATWSLRPPLDLDDRTIGFTITASADNVSARTRHGSIRLRSSVAADDVGPVLAGTKRVAILGDSYSSGEGTGDYVSGTDTATNGCHRSERTYGEALWQDRLILACSGATTVDVLNPNTRNVDERAQIDRLAEAGPVDAVLFTVGGNDVDFAGIITRCVVDAGCQDSLGGPASCVLPGLCGGVGMPNYEEETRGRIAGLAGSLTDVYRAVDATVNSPSDLDARDGRVAPVVVLAYPHLMPLNPHARGRCSVPIGPEEMVFANKIVDELNGMVAWTVERLHRQGVPIYFAADVAEAFLPDHTYCDSEPYLNRLDTIDNLYGRLRNSNPVELPSGEVVYPFAHDPKIREVQEQFHPNTDGYKAMTAALVRWSLGAQAGKPPARRGPAPIRVAEEASRPSRLVIGEQETPPKLSAGTRYVVVADGFAPGSSVAVTLASTARLLGVTQADDAGAAELTVAIPSTARLGDHHMEVSGIDPDGKSRRLVLPVGVGRSAPWWILALGGIGAFFLVVGAVSTAVLRRRPARRALRQTGEKRPGEQGEW